jgi:acetylornithine/succinyldiaminopimelate/putrescine aminotransferase/predicted amino acid dehydrogenase
MEATDRYTRFVSPHIGALLEALNLDVSYHRGSKDTLYMYRHGREVEVLDLVGGYGTNLLGHGHPAIRQALDDYLSTGRPAICSQGSIQQATGKLAEKLSLAVGAATGKNYLVIPVNSGAEAVDAALQHAYFEWHKRLEKLRDEQLQMFGSEEGADLAEIWRGNMHILEGAPVRVIALRQAYHGHTAGSRSLLGNEKKRTLFRQLSRIEPVFIDDRDPGWPEQLETHIRMATVTIRMAVRNRGKTELVDKAAGTIIAAIVEPVVGEGGVRVVQPEFLKALSMFDFPLISDEIQCGLGRTGRFPECADAGYYLFGKALGGGIEKIAAVLIDSTRYRSAFGEHHVSTFGGGEMAATVALMVLKTIEKEDIADRAEKAGILLRSKLEALRADYPEVIARIDGKGLMQAVYFDPGCARESILLRLLFETEKPGYLFAAWFLNRHRIRIFPTLSAPHALRIEPSAFIGEEETDRFCMALEELCRILRERRTYDLFSVIMDDDPFDDRPAPDERFDHYDPHLEAPADGAVRVAFVAHFAYPIREMRMLEPDMIRASDTGLRIFFRKMQILMEMKPVQIMAANLFGGQVHFSFYVIPVDSARLEYLHRTGRRRQVVAKIQEAVDRAVAEGARVISLGGYTSILTNNGLALAEPPGTRIITGNTLTAASGLMHLGQTLRRLPAFNRPNTIAVIGPAGNIGKVITCMLHEQEDICGRLLLVTHSEKRESDILRELDKNGCSRVEVTGIRSLSGVAQADVIVICTNTNDPILFPYHIACDKPVLVSDLSVPPAVSDDVYKMPNVTVMPFSAYVRLPEDPQVVISSYSPPGTLFCCAGEAILLGLEDTGVPLKGRILPGSVKEITEKARRWRFFESIDSMGSFKNSK